MPSAKTPEEPLPDWALRPARNDRHETMQQLITSNPKFRGNAVIADIYYDIVHCEAMYIIATDAGNIITANRDEMLEMYNPGPYILKEFCNPKILQILDEKNQR